MKELFLASILISSCALAAIDKFQEFINYAQGLKDTVPKILTDFKPAEVLSKTGTYTENPPQADYYSEIQSNTGVLEQAAKEEITKDEAYKNKDGTPIPTSGKVVTTAYSARPMVKINQKEEFMQKGKLIMDNANNIITGSSNKHINCEQKKLATCKTVQVEKTCNEALSIQKICEKVATVKIRSQDVIYQGCKKVVITQATWNYCPPGYTQIVYSDMLRPVTYDDIRICTKEADARENVECLGGYLIHGLAHPDFGDQDVKSTQRAAVPKKMNARIRFSNLFSPHMIITVINETTGATICDQCHFTSGQVLTLPFSADKDQVFRFYDHGRLDCGGGRGWVGRGRFCSDWGECCGKGVMVLYIDHINQEKVTDVLWQEPPCYYVK